MSQHGALMGDGAGNATGNDAMSTSGDSVNQQIPPPLLGGEDAGGSLAPQDNVLLGVNTYGSASPQESMPNIGAHTRTSGVPTGVIDLTGGVIDVNPSVGGYDPMQSFGSYQQTQGAYGIGS